MTVVTTLALAGCGGEATSGTDEASLLLDAPPNAVHSGIYTTLARDYDGAESVRLSVRRPRGRSDARAQLNAGGVDFAVLSLADLALAREQGSELVGVMALVQRPLAAVYARPGVASPRDLEGRRAGVPEGRPDDLGALDAVVRGDGGDPGDVRKVEVGDATVAALVDGRVDAVSGLRNVEGIALRDRLDGVREFRVERYGAPGYPELVLCATVETIQDDPVKVQRVVTALRRGYDEVLLDPESAIAAMGQRVEGLDRKLVLRQLAAVSPAFTAGAARYGTLDRRRLRAWADWIADSGLVETPPNVATTFAPRFAAAADDG